MGRDKFDGLTDETRLGKGVSSLAPGPLGKIRVDPLPDGDARPYFEIAQGPRRGARFTITKALTIIGRVADAADIAIDDESISRNHAALGHKDGAFVLYDLGSTNGTFVGGEQITEKTLEHGTDVRFGDTVLTFWTE